MLGFIQDLLHNPDIGYSDASQRLKNMFKVFHVIQVLAPFRHIFLTNNVFPVRFVYL